MEPLCLNGHEYAKRQLCLSDINPMAIKAIQHTTAVNLLADRVSVYLPDALDTIPHSEHWDLVVANPPHHEGEQITEWGLRTFDPGWNMLAAGLISV
jgi:16S rRNA G1207 methylase RsmC